MERSRRSQSSGDKRGTSLLIQQLAAARERKLQGGLAFTTQYKDLLEASEIELLDSDASSSEDIEDADSPASQPTRASPDRENPPATQRNRLVRKDKHKSSIPDHPTMNETVDDLASMIQGIGLSATSQPAGQEQQQQEYRFPSSRSNNSSLHDSGIGSAEQPQQRSGTSTDTYTKQQVISDTGEPAAPCERLSHKPPPQTSHPIKATALQDSNSDSEDEIATQIPRSRKPATATEHDSSIKHHSHQQRLPTHSSSNSAGSSKHVSGDSDQSDSDDDDSGSSSPAAAGSCSSHPASSSSSRGGSNHRTAGSHSSSGSGSSSGGIRSYLEAKAPSAALEPAEGSLVLEGGFCLDVKIASKLYPHQLQGVKWLWSLHRMRKGGILADDMGLGKTMQCSAFLAGSLRSHQAIRALVIAPKTLLAHWEKELRVCGMAARTHCFYGSSEGERSAALRTMTGRGGVMLTTYGMVLHNAAQLRQGLGPVARDADEHEDELDFLCPDPPPGRRILWDYIILDEGHKIKNSRTQLAQRLRELRAMTRVIISGTPVQNNLSELHSLMDFAVPGLLGGAKEFKMIYEKAITAGQDRDASLRVRELGAAKAAELRKIVAPFMLRREKKEVLGSGSGTSTTPAAESSSGTSSASGVVAAAAVSSSGAAAGPAPMGSKHDLVVWLRLQPLQRHIYEAFLHSDAVKEALNSTKSPLAALTVLKKVCDHPALLSERATNLVLSAASKPHKHPKASKTASKQRRNSLDDFIVDDGDETDDDTTNSDASDSDSDSRYINPNSYNPIQSKAAASRAAVAAELDNAGFSDEFITWAEAEGLENRLLSDVHQKGTEASCKSLFVTALLESLVGEGHRTLVFSQSRVMLDIVQAAVVARDWKYCRIDGSMASADARQAEVSRFQAPGADIPVFLLTTQVGGLGLTLTAADRVVIVDPSWNPATDNQSVDRAYRIGQTRDVVVYRLVTCGTVEEKIYRKQVFKGGLSKAGMEEGVQLRYFTHQELHELFKWDPAALSTSETQQLLAQQHSSHTRKTLEQNPDLAKHLTWIEDFPLCAGTSEHGLLFSELDPEGQTLQLTRPEYLTATAAQQGWVNRGPRGSRKGVGLSAAAAAAAGPSAAEISTMLSSLNIAGSSSSGNAGGAAGSSSRMVAASDASASAADQHLMLENRVRDLEISLQKVTADVNNLAARLPDGGVKLKARQAELQVALLAARTQLQQLPPPRYQPPSSASTLSQSAAAAAAGGSAAGAVPSKQHALLDVTNGATAKPSPQQQQQQQQWKARLPYHEVQHPMQVQSQQQQQQHLGQQLLQQQGRCLPPSMQQQQQQQWPAHAGHHPQQQQDYYYQQQPPPPPPARQPQHMHHHQQQQRQHREQQYHQQQNPQRQQQQHLGSLLLQQSQLGRRTVDPVKPGEQQQVADNSSRHLNPRSSTDSDSRVPHQSSSRVHDSGERSQQSAKTVATTTAAVGPAVSAASDQLPPGLVAVTLDGRVPTLSELRQRRHVLKKALQHEDKLKAHLRVEGRDYSPSRQQQWVVMYQEYKEIKQLLQKADQLLAAGSSGNQADPEKAVETIDLT